MEVVEKTITMKGGEFLIKESNAADIFISEEFTEEQLMMRESALEFVEKDVLPRLDEMEKDLSIVPPLIEKAGDLGFLGLGVPEEYGGLHVNFKTALSNNEIFARGLSFALGIGVQTSIGIAPILLYGNESQKAKYLPQLVTGELKTCYCLTEPSAGSDANSGKTKAMPTDDGHYIVNGQKMWITNSGFSDIFIVFAKVEDDKNLSAFIIEKAFGGVSLGAEERKMGIKGSSTRQVFFNNVKVPAENMLGERGAGFKMAVNVLNTGRIKLGGAAIGVGKMTIGYAVNYANERIQFEQPISNFGAIQHKLAEMAMRVYAVDSLVYRTGHNIDLKYNELRNKGLAHHEAEPKSLEEFAIECAIAKVFGTEAQSYIADEGVQIYGGMGFSAETPVERIYRDTRINRIYEGTNEINRMLIVDMLLRKAMRGKLDIMSAAMAVQKDLMSIPSFDEDTALFAAERKVLKNMKKATLMVAGAAAQKLMKKLKTEQEVLMNVADMLAQVYAFESTLLRTEKLVAKNGEAAMGRQLDMLRMLMHSAANIINNAGKEVIYTFEANDEQRMLLMGLKRFTKVKPFDLKAARRRVAKEVIEANAYSF